MSEIKVGEYIRTKKGVIRTVKTIKTGKRDFSLTQQTLINGKYKIEEIVNHSFEPIDLIENGDILRYRINNLSATKIGEVKKYKDTRSLKVYLGVEGFSLEQIEILGIVTKEQFENIEYKVEE